MALGHILGDGNRLLEIREGGETGPLYRTFTYSDAGEIESKQDGAGNLLYALERSSQGRVAGVSGLGFSPQTLGYDPLGLRVRRTVSGAGGANQRFHLEGEHLEAIYTAAGALRAKFLRGSVIDEVVNGYYYLGPDFEPTNYTYHHDPLQSVVGISAPTGSPTQTLRYGPFGNLLASSGTSASTLRYTGREHDSLSGLYYYRARYYDPEIGRFLSEDPMGFSGGDVNLYAYVGNNPLRYGDPTGQCPNCLAAVIGGTIGAVAGGVRAYTSSGGDPTTTVIGAGAGAAAGAWAGASFGAGTLLTAAAGGAASAGAGNFLGQYFGSGGAVNLVEVGAFAASGTIPGAVRGLISTSAAGYGLTSNPWLVGGGIAAVSEVNLGTFLLTDSVASLLPRIDVTLPFPTESMQTIRRTVSSILSGDGQASGSNAGTSGYRSITQDSYSAARAYAK